MGSGKQFVSHGRASIMDTELIVDVHCRQQFREVVQWLVDKAYHFEFERLGTGDSFKPETYRLTITDVSWMPNIVEIAEKMSEYDYDSDGEEERDAA